MAEIRTNALPQLRGTPAPVQDRPVARPQQSGVAAPAMPSTSEMEGLVRGLQQFNQNLGQFTDYSIGEERRQLTEAVTNEAAAAAARVDTSKQTIEEAQAQDLPSNVPLAYGKLFRDTLGTMLVDRAAAKAQSDWLTKFNAEKDKPDFNPEQFMQGFRGEALAGLKDPALAGRMGAKLTEMESALRSEIRKDQTAKLQAEVNSGIAASMEHNFRADMTPDQIAGQYMTFLPEWRQLGKTPKELATMMFQRLAYISDAKGGDPAVFNVFDAVDPTTKQSLLTMNPELATVVANAKIQAANQQTQTISKANEAYNLQVSDTVNQMIEKAPQDVTMEVVMNNFGPTKAYKTHDEAAAVLARARKAMEEKGGMLIAYQALQNGTLWRYEPEVQKKTLEMAYGPAVDALAVKAVQGDEQSIHELAKTVVALQSQSGSSVNFGAIERLIQSATQNLPGDAPTPSFKAVAKLYSLMSAAPDARDRYFKDDAAAVLRQYNNAVQAGTDDKGAYGAAVRSVSPEAKAEAEKFVKTDAFKNKLPSFVKEVVGSSFVPTWLGGNGRVTNSDHVEFEVSAAVRDYKARNPYATKDEAAEYARSWVRSNYVMDENTGAAVKVPSGMADELTKRALSEYSKRLTEVWRLKDRNDGEWSVRFMPEGENGVMQVILNDGSEGGNQLLGKVPLSAVRDSFMQEQNLTGEERSTLNELNRQLRAGALDPAFVEQSSAVIGKARALKMMPSETAKAVEKLQLDTVKANLQKTLSLDLGAPSLENLQFNPQRTEKLDNKMTAKVAKDLAAAGLPGSGSAATGLAASLITMGEGVVSRVSYDPAKGAGHNIGMGYNLKANAKNARQDLQRAGVPDDRVDAVLNGQAELTSDQAKRLLLVSLPRYEKLARDTAEKTAKGLWSRMTQHQQAVMIDVAYQTGNPEQFRRAWSAVAAGDMEAFKNETKVFYTNRQGERVEDKRRGDLRAAILRGSGEWVAVIDRYGSFPSNAIEAVALNQPKQ